VELIPIVNDRIRELTSGQEIRWACIPSALDLKLEELFRGFWEISSARAKHLSESKNGHQGNRRQGAGEDGWGWMA
jgi:hypothetical protein